MNTLIRFLSALSVLAQIGFLYLFVHHNSPGLSSTALVGAIALIYGLLWTSAAVYLIGSLSGASPADRNSVVVARVLMLASGTALLAIFFDATVTDYYQPLSLYDDAIAALAVSWGSLILALLTAIVIAPRLPLNTLRGALATSLVALMGLPLAASLNHINQPQTGDAVDAVADIFVGGQQGYDIYRIPALIVIPAGSKLANGDSLQHDRLLAFAEARRDGNLDTGVIDLVMRYSDDGGKKWSEQQLVCRHEVDGKQGKCGNATPVYDAQAGNVVLAYNLSGLPGDGPHRRSHSAHIKLSLDGGLSWGEPMEVARDNFVFGPGHGIQKQVDPAKGRLVIPGYVDTHAQVLYSDDHGKSWLRGAPLDTGNETEVAELADGRLYLTTRHRAPIGRPPSPNGRLYSYSEDGGNNWSATSLDTALTTPICQASVLSHDSGQLLFSNPSHPRSRVRLKIKASADAGKSWQRTLLVYAGPAGYSQLASDSEGNVYALFENGVMSYSEKITLARIPVSAITR